MIILITYIILLSYLVAEIRSLFDFEVSIQARPAVAILAVLIS